MNIQETIERYEAVCKSLGQSPNAYIMRTFKEHKEMCIFDVIENMHLSLAGNNHIKADPKTERLQDQDVKALSEALKNNTYVTSLDLRYNRLTNEGAGYLAGLLEESTSIWHLNLMANDIKEEGARLLAKALHTNQSLKVIKLTGNKVGDKGGMYFAQMLQINETLQELDLSDTDQRIESLIALSTVLHHNRSLQALNVDRPILFTHSEEPTIHFAKMLKVNRTLKQLHMMKYDMRDFGITRMVENLLDNFCLTHLSLRANRLTRDGAEQLAKVLRMNTALQVLDLGNNRLQDDGAIHIAKALLTSNTNLKTLVVKYNEMNGKGLCALADCLKMNTTLDNIFIWGNNHEESACIAFASLIEAGRLTEESTDVRPYVVDGVTYLAELNTDIRRHYYWKPVYGDDVPDAIV